MRIKLATPLIGEFPRYADVKLPDNVAVTAQNMRLDSGVLKPLNAYTLLEQSGEFAEATWNV